MLLFLFRALPADLALVPSTGKLREIRLGIRAPTDDTRRGLSLKGGFAASFREQWAGQLLFAALSRAELSALVAFFESLDGRVTPFGVELAAGFASQYVGNARVASATLASTPSLGADKIRLTISGSPTLRPGTLVGLGETRGTFQLVEVMPGASAVADGATDIYIAPRIRVPLDGATAIAGTVTARFYLAADALDSLEISPSSGSLTVDVVDG